MYQPTPYLGLRNFLDNTQTGLTQTLIGECASQLYQHSTEPTQNKPLSTTLILGHATFIPHPVRLWFHTSTEYQVTHS